MLSYRIFAKLSPSRQEAGGETLAFFQYYSFRRGASKQADSALAPEPFLPNGLSAVPISGIRGYGPPGPGQGTEFPVNFASDNTAGVAPGIMDALVRANDGFALGYGNDDLTRAVEKRIGEVFRMRCCRVPGSDRDGSECLIAGACNAVLGRSFVPRAGAHHVG